MSQQKSNYLTGADIADKIRQAVQKIQKNEQATPPRNASQEALAQAIRTLARSRVSNTLRQLRAVHGLSYEDVAAQTGLSKQVLFDIEYTERRLSLDELRLLAICYHVSESDILGIDIV